MKRLPVLILLLFLAGSPIALFAQDDGAKRLDELFQTWSQPGTPGAAVAVIQHGKLVFEKGYGLANLEYDIPVTPHTVYHVASVSKQFRAMALVLLEQAGKLSLEDNVHKYLPELPDYGHPTTRSAWSLSTIGGSKRFRMAVATPATAAMCFGFLNGNWALRWSAAWPASTPAERPTRWRKCFWERN